MNNKLHIDLPDSPYQCGVDFALEENEQGWFFWEGAGRFEGDWCAFEGYRTVEQAAADAIFRLAIADGRDSAESVIAVFSVGLPTEHLDLDDIDYP